MDSIQLLLVAVSLPGAIIATLLPKYLQARLAYWLANRGSGGESVYPWESTSGRSNRRLSANPLVHFDLLGTGLAVLTRIGWGRELRIKPEAFERPLLHSALVAFSGPVINILIGLAFTAALIPVLGIVEKPADADLWYTLGMAAQKQPLFRYLFLVVFATAFINFRVAIFNLIPLPPLDLGQLLRAFLPVKVREKVDAITRYTAYVILAFLLLVMLLEWGWFDIIVSTFGTYVMGLTGYDGWELLGLFGVLLKLPL